MGKCISWVLSRCPLACGGWPVLGVWGVLIREPWWFWCGWLAVLVLVFLESGMAWGCVVLCCLLLEWASRLGLVHLVVLAWAGFVWGDGWHCTS